VTVRLTPGLYRSLVLLGGDDAATGAQPLKRDLSTRLEPEQKAIYIVLDMNERVVYVGSVSRDDERGLSRRLQEHGLRHGWKWLVVIPLVPSTPTTRVRELEGAVGAVLRPTHNRRLPKNWIRSP
jgi:hypothetical protein